MTPLTQIAIYAWFPIVVLFFREMKGYKAIATAFLGAALFLPCASLRFPGIPDLTKTSVTVYACMFSTIMFYPILLIKFRPKWFDIPMLIYCFTPIPSAVVNEQGIAHGISLTIVAFATWGLPYFLGRIYFTTLESVHFLAQSVFVGAVIYIPFCLFELRMSPILHKVTYGFFPGNWSVMRYGGYRPSVFMHHGLQLGMFMTASVMMGYVLWRFKIVRKIYGFDIKLLLLALVATTVLCKATGALFLLILGFAALIEYRYLRTSLMSVTFALISILYITVRSTGAYDGSDLVKLTAQYLNPQRASSLNYRFVNEDLLVAKALEVPILGWGGNGRNRVYNDYGKDSAISDGFWIITLGLFGYVGLGSIYLAFMMIPVLAALRYSRRKWKKQDFGSTFVIAIFLLLFLIDCLLNSFPMGIYQVCLGAISTIFGSSIAKLKPVDQVLVNHIVDAPPNEKRLWPPKMNEEPQLAT